MCVYSVLFCIVYVSGVGGCFYYFFACLHVVWWMGVGFLVLFSMEGCDGGGSDGPRACMRSAGYWVSVSSLTLHVNLLPSSFVFLALFWAEVIDFLNF